MLLTAERLVRNNNLLNTAQYTTIHHATVIPSSSPSIFPSTTMSAMTQQHPTRTWAASIQSHNC